MKKVKRIISIWLCIFLLAIMCHPIAAEEQIAQLTIDASQNEGVYSPNVMGNMFEWASDYMNGSWAQKLNNRNFETETLDFLNSPLYDHFSGSVLDTAKWTPYTYGSSAMGNISLSNSLLQITGVAGARFGVLSQQIDEQNADVTIKVELNSYTGVNAMVSLNADIGPAMGNNIEFGVEDGYLKIFGDGVTSYVGNRVACPVTLNIIVGHLTPSGRTIMFYANDNLVYTIENFTNFAKGYKVFLYGWGSGQSLWESVSIYKNSIYDSFDATSITNHFSPCLLEGSLTGSVAYSNGFANIKGADNSRYGIISNYIKGSSTNWTGVETILNSYTGVNALMNIYGGDGTAFNHFIEFGVENGHLVVYTASSTGNWSGQKVTYPCTLRIELSPYYANGRNIRFYYNNSLVYALWENSEIPAPDYRLFLYGYGNSVTKWDTVNLYQEHFTDIAGPNFEGASLPNDWEIDSLNNGGFGTVNSHDGICTITGVKGSRFGVGCASFDLSDCQPYRIVAKLNSYSGTNALLHITTQAPHSGFANFVEFGIENGCLKVFTPSGSWTGPNVSTPARLTVEVSPYSSTGRNLTFIYNGEPVYYLENCTALENKEFRTFVYGYGESTSVWDYVDAYPVQSWQISGSNAWGKCEQEYMLNTVSGMYGTHISIKECADGSFGVAQGGISVTSNHQYEFSAWLKNSGNQEDAYICLRGTNGLVYADATISNITSTMQKFSVVLTPDSTDTAAELFVGGTSVGDVWLDQVSFMPLDSSEACYGGWRTDFVNALKELNPGALRWPGGILSDWYDWENGVGNRDMRAPLYFAQWNAIWMSNDVGIDEFLQLCAALGIAPVINVNYATSTAQHAADFVEYVNGDISTVYGALRAANGHASPYGITWWEIGNETWGAWVPNPSNANDFANGYRQFYTAMKSSDSTIKCIGEGGDGNSYSQLWNTTVLSDNASIMDEISIHYYSPQNLPIGYSDIDVFRASVAAPISVRERLLETQSIISATHEDVKIAVTEYNAMYFGSMLHRARSMEAALQVAGLLNAFFEYPGLTDHNDYSCLTQFWDGSAIRLSNSGTLLTPSYYVLDFYANYRGEVKVASTMASPTFSNIAIGNTPAMNNVPYLDRLVTRSLDGSTLYIALMNRSESSPFNLPISIENAIVNGEATIHSLSASNYLDSNTWQNTSLITPQTTTLSVGNTFSITIPKLTVMTIEIPIAGVSAIASPLLCGKVVDENGNALSGVTVTASNGQQTYTDRKGYYEFSVPPDEYWVQATCAGFESSYMNNIYVYASSGATAQPIILEYSQ